MPQSSVPVVTVEQFFLNHADKLQIQLVAGGAGISNRILEGAVHRPGLGPLPVRAAHERRADRRARRRVAGDGADGQLPPRP